MTVLGSRGATVKHPPVDRSPAVVGPAAQAPRIRKPTRQRIVDDVVEALEEAILSGRMPAGERLLETWIGTELGVSRTTVREALLKLERRGLVVSQPRRGTFVTRISRQDSEDLRATRALLEAYALSIGYAAIDEETIAQLDALLDEMRTCVLPDDVPRLVKIDIAFHSLLIAGANTPRVRDLWASLNGQMSVLFLSALESRHASIDDVVSFHQELLDDIRSGDPARAQQGVIVHYLGNEDQPIPEAIARGIAEVAATVTARLSLARSRETDAT